MKDSILLLMYNNCNSETNRLYSTCFNIYVLRLVSTMWFYTKATPTNDTNHIKAVHIVQPIMWGPYDAATHY